MKAFLLLILTTLSALAQEGKVAEFDLRGMDQPMTIQELVSVVGFLAVVGGGVFLMIRLRGSDKPPASLNSRHIDE